MYLHEIYDASSFEPADQFSLNREGRLTLTEKLKFCSEIIKRKNRIRKLVSL